jgi:hypothetical protein
MGTTTLDHVRTRAWLLVLAAACVLPSCASDGNLNIFGYSTRPNYDPSIRTVRVPIFKNETIRDTTREGMEYQLTRAVIREVQLKTPFEVRNDGCPADTELLGKIVQFNKQILNRNQLNEVREAEMTLGVELLWTDLRSGEVLSQMRVPLPYPLTEEDVPVTPATPALVQSVSSFIPELGESITTARQRNINRLAVQIVSMMEMKW